MAEKFEPEIGQAAFSNSGWEEPPLPSYIEKGIAMLGELISDGKWENNPINNVGAEFSNTTFVIRAYCWCDGEREGHRDQCPPNFEFFDNSGTPIVQVRWYKHLRRSATINKKVEFKDWWIMLSRCIQSVLYPPEKQT